MRIPRYETYRRLLIEPIFSAPVRYALAAALIFVGIPVAQVMVEPDWLKWTAHAGALAVAIFLALGF